MGILKIQKMKSRVGLTLIELLMVIVIVGVLAAIAVPMYSGYMQRARRADAKTALEQVRAAQEMWKAEKGSYAINDGNGTAIAKLRTTMGAPNTTVSKYYTWGFTVKTATQFTVHATPTGGQPASEWLEINQDGTKTPADKWAK
jgi:type IV pilus assembly protein PilE